MATVHYFEESFNASFYNFSFQLAGKKPLPVILCPEKLTLSDGNSVLLLFEGSTHMDRKDTDLPQGTGKGI